MIYEKSAGAPKVKRYVLACTPAELKRRGSVTLFNLKERDGALVVAQHIETVKEISPNAIGLLASADKVYSSLNSGCVCDLATDVVHLMTFTARGIASYCSPAGKRTDYVFGERGQVHSISDGEVVHLPKLGAATAGTVFRERLFLALGSTITYSAPLDPEKFAPEEEDTGKIALSEYGGDILALVPYGNDCLLVFRAHEILELRADANDLNFSFSKVKFDGGEIAAGSVQSCGRLVVFYTERGFYAFDGNGCKSMAVGGGVSPVSPVVSATHGGLYYICVQRDSFKYMLVLDPEKEEYFLSGASPTMLAGNKDGLWLNAGTTLLRIGGTGYSAFNYSVLGCDIDLSEWSGKYVLEDVTLAGKGSYTLSVQAGSGNSTSYNVKAYGGTALRHTLPLGKLHLVFHTFDEDAVIREIVFHMREVGA